MVKWHAYICQEMAPLSAAEKQRRYRARRDADPEKAELPQQREREVEKGQRERKKT